MSLLIGIDLGTTRVGVAVCQDHTGIPEPQAVWKRAQGEAERKLGQLVTDLKASIIIVGLPLGSNGEETPICENVRNFCRRIQKRLKAQIFFVDEYGSSEEAKERLKMNHNGTPEDLDAYAACIILERFLDQSKSYHVGRFDTEENK